MPANIYDKELYIEDNLYLMRGVNTGSVPLICTDPPFASGEDYNLVMGEGEAEQRAYGDAWSLNEHIGPLDLERLRSIPEVGTTLHNIALSAFERDDDEMCAYCLYMAPRLVECHRILTETGSMYLHCDETAAAYLKMMMDAIFGRRNFRRGIIWSSGDASGYKSQANNWIRGHDVILYYVKDAKNFTFNKQYLPLAESTIKRYDKVDAEGRFYKIYRDKETGAERIVYLDKSKGRAFGDVWSDIPSFQTVNNTGELVGFDTQKPVALYERMISASSNPGDLVLDPFVGCSTTIVAAHNLGREWCGFDISSGSIDKLRKRLPLGLFAPDWKPIIKNVETGDKLLRTDLGHLPKYNSAENKALLFQLQKGRCAGCNKKLLKQQGEQSVDHIIPIYYNGYDIFTNLQLMHRSCNSKKSNLTMSEYQRVLLEDAGIPSRDFVAKLGRQRRKELELKLRMED